jgi:hypothetical protein
MFDFGYYSLDRPCLYETATIWMTTATEGIKHHDPGGQQHIEKDGCHIFSGLSPSSQLDTVATPPIYNA